jgi:hypothetical protein
MTKLAKQFGRVLPPRKHKLYDPDAKTSRVAISVGLIGIVAMIAAAWYVRNR